MSAAGLDTGPYGNSMNRLPHRHRAGVWGIPPSQHNQGCHLPHTERGGQRPSLPGKRVSGELECEQVWSPGLCLGDSLGIPALCTSSELQGHWSPSIGLSQGLWFEAMSPIWVPRSPNSFCAPLLALQRPPGVAGPAHSSPTNHGCPEDGRQTEEHHSYRDPFLSK